MNNLKYKLTTPWLMWAIVIIGGLILYKVVPPGSLFSTGKFGIIILILGIVDWFYVTFSAGKVHRKAPKSVHNIDQLVTEGAYSVVRHPMYLADIVLAWCVFLFHPGTRTLAVVLWLSLVLLFWADLEERMLEEKFLDDYRAYKRRVPKFFPRFKN